MPTQRISFRLNGRPVTIETHPLKRLLDVLREDFGLTGTKEGCGEGECGACSAIVDDYLVNTCLLPVLQAEGSRISTIESVAENPTLQVIQQAFIEHGGAQCGICTPGMIMAAIHLLSHCPHPTLEQIREGLSGNLCRCTGYTKIFEAVEQASRRNE
ncbi:MAG TPA: (2Fe-2S)-binding protein [Bryobacteraceae bacterium]|jgi:carbon-monoxide dehydrogenase small subunit